MTNVETNLRQIYQGEKMETMCNAWIFNHNAVSERKWVDLKHGIIKV